MNKKVLAVYDEYMKGFAKGNFKSTVSRGRYNFCLPVFSKKLPCFLSYTCSDHHRDIKNIETTLRRRKIRKEETSIIVLDKHTDMYEYAADNKKNQEVIKYQGKVNMTNWILYMLKNNYPDISLVGVEDFTSSQGGGNENYKGLNENISFFVGKEFDLEREFGTIEEAPKIKSVEDFFQKPLRQNSFISLDCDVSKDFSPQEYYCDRYCGSLKLQDVVKVIEEVKSKSRLIGVSIHGVVGGPLGFYDTFREKEKEIKEIIEALN